MLQIFFHISLSLYLDTSISSADNFSYYIRRLSETDLHKVENMWFSLMKRDVLLLGSAFM